MIPDFAIVGRGLMGTACAHHLVAAGHSVTLVGPDEPADRGAFSEPFGSFHDAGRITRRLADDPVWAELAGRSIARYRDVEARSEVPFFRPGASMISAPREGPGAAVLSAVSTTAARLDIPHHRLAGAALADAVPMFALDDGTAAVLDPSGGIIDPRAMRRAHERLAARAGASILGETVVGLGDGTLTLRDGRVLPAGHVILATGAYAAASPLCEAPEMRVFGRTVVLAEVDAATAGRLGDMPSLIHWGAGADHDIYLLPPIRYPDGRICIKIGGEGDSPRLVDAATAQDWFQSTGSPIAAGRLLDTLRGLMPDLAIRSVRRASCAVSFTPSGHPYIERIGPRLTLLTGGNGAAAKCADELGRLGALAALGSDPAAICAGADFRVRFA